MTSGSGKVRITSMTVLDVRFPTSQAGDGSDAMHVDPDYSAAYVILHTNHPKEIEGHGFTFTIGRGTEVVVSAIHALEPLVVGNSIDLDFSSMGSFAQGLVRDSQLRWIGPEKGAIHLATAAIVNAAWDLLAKHACKPLWQVLLDLSTDEVLALVDFRYLEDALTPTEARSILDRLAPTRPDRIRRLAADGLPAYTTSAGWLGYDDEKIRRLCREGLQNGFDMFKLKVGADLSDDLRRIRIVREEIGPDRRLAVDANQCWSVGEAIEWIEKFRPFDPYWVEEPTSPDDVLGHAAISRAVAPIRVATGEHVQNRVVFKQFFQARAFEVCQVDACRLGGVNEVIAVLLLAAKYGVPVCPHAGGVGLCELVQHLAAFDYVAISGSLDDRVVEYVDHLHEHFVDPVVVVNGRYRLPMKPGYSAEMKQETLLSHRFPDGPVWSGPLLGEPAPERWADAPRRD